MQPSGEDDLRELEHIGHHGWGTSRRSSAGAIGSAEAGIATTAARAGRNLEAMSLPASNELEDDDGRATMSPASSKSPQHCITADGGIAATTRGGKPPLNALSSLPPSSGPRSGSVGASASCPAVLPTLQGSGPRLGVRGPSVVFPGGVACPPMLSQALRTVAMDEDLLLELPSAEVRVGPFTLSFRPPRRGSIAAETAMMPSDSKLGVPVLEPHNNAGRTPHGSLAAAARSDRDLPATSSSATAGAALPRGSSIFASVFGSRAAGTGAQAVGEDAAAALAPLPSVAQALAVAKLSHEAEDSASGPVLAASAGSSLSSMLSAMLPSRMDAAQQPVTDTSRPRDGAAKSGPDPLSAPTDRSHKPSGTAPTPTAGSLAGGRISELISHSASSWVRTAGSATPPGSVARVQNASSTEEAEEGISGRAQGHSLPGRVVLRDSKAFQRLLQLQQRLAASGGASGGTAASAVSASSGEAVKGAPQGGGGTAVTEGFTSVAKVPRARVEGASWARHQTPATISSTPHIGDAVALLPPGVIAAALRARVLPDAELLEEPERLARGQARKELQAAVKAIRSAPWGAFETLVAALDEENERLRCRSLLLEEQAGAFKAVMSRLEKERAEAMRRVVVAEAERDGLRNAVERLRSSSGSGYEGSVSRAVDAIHAVLGKAAGSRSSAAPQDGSASLQKSPASDAGFRAEESAVWTPRSELGRVDTATADSLLDGVRHLLTVLEDVVEREAMHASAQTLGISTARSVWARGSSTSGPAAPSTGYDADAAAADGASVSHAQDVVATEVTVSKATETAGGSPDAVTVHVRSTAGSAAAAAGGEDGIDAEVLQAPVPRMLRSAHSRRLSSRPMGDMLAGGPGRGGRGLSILCLDGGGIKGLCMLESLIHIEKRTGRCIHELFDIICGTSTGGLLATLLAMKRMPLSEIPAVYETIRKRMEDNTTVVSNMARLAGGVSFDNRMTEELLREILGEEKLDEVPSIPKCFVVAAACNSTPAQPYLFRSYELTRSAAAASEFLGASHCKVWEAVRSTTAAPTFYHPAVVGKQRFVDGGILANNPTLIALAEAAVLWPDATVSCVVSLGTGMPSSRKHTASSALDWAGYIISDLCMSSHVTHAIASSLLGEGQYFRIDPPCVDVALSETKPTVIQNMLESIRAFLKTEEQQSVIRRIARLLTARRPGPALSSSAAAATQPTLSSVVDVHPLNASHPAQETGPSPGAELE